MGDHTHQANRHFGIAGEPCENPKYLDKLIGIVGGEALSYSQRLTC